MDHKISIRFFNDHEVRAIWDDDQNKWWFSIVDIIAAITDSPRPRKYWNDIKRKLTQEWNQLSAKIGQLKLVASDGKKYATDCFSQDDIVDVIKTIPNKNTLTFLDWFLYSDNSIDGQSKKKAYTLFESNLIHDFEIGTVKSLQQIHAYLFGGLYDFAGQIRTKNISKWGFRFASAEFLDTTLQSIERMPETNLEQIIKKYIEMNIAHPFMEGNGRTARIWLDLMLKKQLQKSVDWSKISKNDYMNAMIASPHSSETIIHLIQHALTDDIHSRDMFMKGINYSYYYEEE